MSALSTESTEQNPEAPPYDYEAIVVGAGVSGIYQIKRLLDLGIHATVLDANSDIGGTWYNNRYPGARFDSESYAYGYSFNQEVLDEWHWKERFSPQPETLSYLNFVVDKLDLRKHMQFDARIKTMIFDEDNDIWRLSLDDGRTLSARFVITALGPLSTPTLPKIDGQDEFKGISFHPHHWPHDLKDLRGKRVGIIGTGATAIQIIPEVAKQASKLTVFQRRPNWAAPLNNDAISAQEMDSIRGRYDEIFAACARTPAAFEHGPDPRSFYDLSADERREFWDRLYEEPGFSIWLANFAEIFTDEKANAEFSDYIAERIRRRLDDPLIAEQLIPKDHGFGIQRVPLETNYFEAYNRDNVELIDSKATPIERITAAGLRTSEREFEFDIIIYATGFDSFTGAYDRIDIRGLGGKKLRDKWADGPQTYLGMMIAGFPNMAMLGGPQTAAANFPRGSEVAVDWILPLLRHARDNGYTRFNAKDASQQKWHENVKTSYEGMLMSKAQSWITGYNSNLDGHEYGHTRYNIFATGGVEYTKHLQHAVENNYAGIDFTCKQDVKSGRH